MRTKWTEKGRELRDMPQKERNTKLANAVFSVQKSRVVCPTCNGERRVGEEETWYAMCNGYEDADGFHSCPEDDDVTVFEFMHPDGYEVSACAVCAGKMNCGEPLHVSPPTVRRKDKCPTCDRGMFNSEGSLPLYVLYVDKIRIVEAGSTGPISKAMRKLASRSTRSALAAIKNLY